MPQTRSLTPEQMTAAGYLAAGLSQGETGDRLNVSRKTINRWAMSQEFKEEVERRKRDTLAAHDEAIERVQAESVDRFYIELEEYRTARINSYKAQISIASKLLKKLGRRLDDLPEEAIAPSVLASLLTATTKLMGDGMDGWAEMIGVRQVTEKLNEAQQQESGD